MIEYIRNCPNCNSEITYKNPRSFKWADRDGKVCRRCYSVNISKTLKRAVESGEFIPHIRNKNLEINKPFVKKCPNCSEDMYFTSKKGLLKSTQNKTVCNKCSTYIHNKTFNNIITEEHRKKMRASKAGFSSWEEYVEKYPKKQFYKREVWRLTYKHPLETLTNWDKRGRCGVDGVYQLDHIVSINEGWKGGIPAEEIAKWENLRMIPWKENRSKW
jgi:ribosomal protein L40E